MIRRSRSAIDEPASLKSDEAQTETASAIQFFGVEENRDKTFEFKMYSKDDVKQALNGLFAGKCAYCESKYLHVEPVDVEHYRPKGAVSINGKRSKPGYYWLAATWDNLLPSCIGCNRARTQVFAGEDAAEEQEARTGGKENKFPLTSEDKRARWPQDLESEQTARLLIHPCRDHPDTHLKFLGNGSVRGLTDKGRASIDAYALRRATLVERRRVLLRDLAKIIAYILDDVDTLARHPHDDQIKANIKKKMDDVNLAGDEDEEYTALVRDVILPFKHALRTGKAREFAADLFEQIARVH